MTKVCQLYYRAIADPSRHILDIKTFRHIPLGGVPIEAFMRLGNRLGDRNESGKVRIGSQRFASGSCRL